MSEGFQRDVDFYSVEVQGIEEVRARLQRLADLAGSDRMWQEFLGETGAWLRYYAAMTSPVVTGSYQASHRLAVDGKTVTLGIDPAARNIESGILVRDYAEPVEARHAVYWRTRNEAPAGVRRAIHGILARIAE